MKTSTNDITPITSNSRTGDTPPKAQRRVLVVEDNELLRRVFSDLLKAHGYLVETAANGADGLRRLAGTKFDLVVTDWDMPVLDGGSMVLALRAEGHDTPVVMLSGSLPHRPLPDAIAQHVYAALSKPIGLSALASVVTAALSSAFCAV